MCLSVDSGVNIPSVAKTDIVCYKVVKVGRTSWFTPYRLMAVEMGGKYECDLDDPTGYEIERGFHSFSNKGDAFGELRYWQNRMKNDYYVMVECIIPKGAHYYTGTFDRTKGYASDKINYIKMI